MVKVRTKCGFLCGIDVGVDGSRGGLSLGWKEGLSVTLQSYSNNFIDVKIQESSNSPKWRWIGFYGSSYNHNRIFFVEQAKISW